MRLTELILSSLLVILVIVETPVFAGDNKCPKLRMQNGRVKIRARGKMAYFKCRKRYTRLGEKFAVCLRTGTWSHPTPMCIAQGCPDLGSIPNTQITESYNGAMLKFECPVGTKRRGPETITCNGKYWSDAAPSCESGLTLKCDFEEEGLCGWSQDESDNFDWTRKSGKTPTMSTGPPGDHTTGSGNYLFTESSSPRKVGDVARLISPAYPPTLKDLCFSFWYHMQGPEDENAVGSLEVFVKPETASYDIDPEFYMEGNQGPEWQRGFVQIPNQDEIFKIIIVGTRKEGFVSDIAIDDLRLFNCSEETTTAVPATATVQPSVTDAASDNITTVGNEVTTKIRKVYPVTKMSTDSTLITTTVKTVTTSVTNATTSVPVTTKMTTSPTTIPTTAPTTRVNPTTVTTTNPPTSRRTRRTKISTSTTAVTSSIVTSSAMTSSLTTSSRKPTRVTTKQQTTTTTPNKAVTTVYNFSNLATDVMEISTKENPTSQKQSVSPVVTQKRTDTSTQADVNVTSSGNDLFPGSMGNDINMPSTSTVNQNSTNLPTSFTTVMGNVGGSRQKTGSTSNASVMPLVIGITAGIVVGMIVIGITAWLWARSNRKKKEREAAEDEMYMISTADAAGFNYK